MDTATVCAALLCVALWTIAPLTANAAVTADRKPPVETTEGTASSLRPYEAHSNNSATRGFTPPNGFSAEYKEQPITQEQTDSHDDSPTRLSVKTNIIYDLLLTPNIGIEVPIGRRVSVAADWVYAWWSSNSSHRCWRIYGGEIEGRYWLRSGEAQQRLTRHHIGVYAQAFTYDFAFGRHGRMGGKPGASMWQKAMLGAGVSYGYAVRMGKAMRMDFTIGIGYVTGDYHKYHYDNGCYVYDSTHRMNYFGPTRAEASLVWDLPLHRQKKGGAR